MSTPTSRRPGRPTLKVLGALEIEILRILWQRGRGTAREVSDAVGVEHPLAYTTVATTLDKLAAKGLVVKEAEMAMQRRAYPYVYEPALDRKGLALWIMMDVCRDLELSTAERQEVAQLLGEGW